MHAPSLKSLPDVEVVAIAGRSKEKAQKVAAALDIPHAVAGFRGLLDFHPDAVMIALPPAENALATAYFIEHGIPVLCEKPLAGDVQAAARLVALGDHLPHAVDFQFPELPAFIVARESLLRGEIGSIAEVRLTWLVESYAVRNRLKGWKQESGGATGGVLPLLVSHVFYLAEWLNACLVGIDAQLSAEGMSWSPEMPTAPDTVRLRATFENGSVLNAEISNAAEGEHIHIWRFLGEHGELCIENPLSDYMSGFSTRIEEGGGVRMLHSRAAKSDSDGRIAPFLSLASRFLAGVRSGQKTYPDFRSGWRVQCAIDACMRSHVEGRTIPLSDYRT